MIKASKITSPDFFESGLFDIDGSHINFIHQDLYSGKRHAASLLPAPAITLAAKLNLSDKRFRATYRYAGNVGLNPKQFKNLATDREIKYSGNLFHCLLDIKEKYITKYSFVLPVYTLHNIFQSYNIINRKSLLVNRRKAKRPFIHNFILPLVTDVEKFTDRAYTVKQLPTNIIFMNLNSYEYQLIEKYNRIIQGLE